MIKTYLAIGIALTTIVTILAYDGFKTDRNKVYVVSSEAYDSIDDKIIGSEIDGVFESKQKALNYVKERYGTDYSDIWENGNWVTYKYNDEYNEFIDVYIAEYIVN